MAGRSWRRGVRQTACTGFATAARQIAGKPAPTPTAEAHLHKLRQPCWSEACPRRAFDSGRWPWELAGLRRALDSGRWPWELAGLRWAFDSGRRPWELACLRWAFDSGRWPWELAGLRWAFDSGRWPWELAGLRWAFDSGRRPWELACLRRAFDSGRRPWELACLRRAAKRPQNQTTETHPNADSSPRWRSHGRCGSALGRRPCGRLRNSSGWPGPRY